MKCPLQLMFVTEVCVECVVIYNFPFLPYNVHCFVGEIVYLTTFVLLSKQIQL